MVEKPGIGQRSGASFADRSNRVRGLSIISVLVLISIVVVVAAAMTAVFTMNMNVTQRASNGSIALAEAEAGITEVLYQITREENVEDRNGKNPKIKWGLAGETIKGTITPEMGPERAYHVVTFDRGSPYPYSTNNTTLDNDTGYLGRTVPDGMLHIVSTGYCNGQYRTVECVLQKPPFPFGLATSGPIVSVDPITVKGTSSAGVYDPDEEGDRPGHLLTNSPDGVNIGDAPGRKTEITGFVKSSGGVTIAQPAEVRGGVRTFADASTLIDIDVKAFDFNNDPEQKGVVTIVDSLYVKDQKLDVMYRYSGPHLIYKGSVTLEKAMLYVDGDLTIEGPLQGEGLVVVDGNAHFKSGTSLLGTSKMAVLASGDITIEGDNNYFMGLVYCEGNLKASNISIVGTTVVNAEDSSKGSAELQNVGIISNEETRDMTIEVVSSSDAGRKRNSGDGIIPALGLGGGYFGYNPAGMNSEGHYDTVGLVDESNATTIDDQASDTAKQIFDAIKNGGDIPKWERVPAHLEGDSGPLWDRAEELYELVETIQALENALGSGPGPGAPQSEIEAWEQARLDFLGALEAAQKKFAKELGDLGRAIVEFRAGQAGHDGSFKDGLAKEDVKKDIRFNLNEYLPESERVKVSFWKVYSRRL